MKWENALAMNIKNIFYLYRLRSSSLAALCLWAFYFNPLSLYCAAAEFSEGGADLPAKINAEYFCNLVDINITQKRRTYFGNEDFRLENAIANAWKSQVENFIKSKGLSGVDFMAISWHSFGRAYIVAGEYVYCLRLEPDSEVRESAKLVSEEKTKLCNFENLSEKICALKKAYFEIDKELFPQRFNRARVFCMFADEADSRSFSDGYESDGLSKSYVKYIGAYSIRHDGESLDNLLKFLESRFKESAREKNFKKI